MDILMPQLGETVTEGRITNWYKNVGDTIKADEALFDLETDKVSTEIPSPIAGVVAGTPGVAGVRQAPPVNPQTQPAPQSGRGGAPVQGAEPDIPVLT